MPAWEQEDVSTRAKRASRAQELMNEGKSHKHAWFLAFQEIPRVTDPWKNATFKDKSEVQYERQDKA